MKNMYVVLVLAMLLTTSCINTKRIVYLEDMREDISYPMNAQPEMRIQRDDRLSIIVNSRNPELTVPFNISTGGDFQVTSNGDVSTTAGSPEAGKGVYGRPQRIYRIPDSGQVESGRPDPQAGGRPYQEPPDQ